MIYSTGQYSVYQFFIGDSHEAVNRFVDAKTALQTAHNLTTSVGGQLGTTRRVIITDCGDSIIFEWKFEKGVTWPTLNGSDPQV